MPEPAPPAARSLREPRDPRATPEILAVAEATRAITDEVGSVIVGKKDVLRKVTLGILANGHILFEDFPGLAKTLMANMFAMTLGARFARIQFTPDLLPSDITGSYIFHQQSSEFKMREGPIFSNVILADEINRAPPKTQAALLEAMQEGQTTIEGRTHKLPRPFLVLATQNPIEYEGTYPLPEAQMDRFIMRLSVGYPTEPEEAEILARRDARHKDESQVRVLSDPARVVALQQALETVALGADIRAYIARIVARTRNDPRILVGASPRGSLALFKLAKANAAASGRGYVVPDDVKSMSGPALAHRIILGPEARLRNTRADDVVAEIVGGTATPRVQPETA